MLKFQGRVVVITGSGTGIGKAIAIKFAENGASIVILGRRKEPLEETAKSLKEIIDKVKSNAFVKIFAGVDVSDEEGVSRMFDELKSSGNVDILVNNAGVSGPVTCFANSPITEFKSTVAIHLTGTFWTSIQALKAMKAGAKIITISTFFTEERPLEQRPYRFRSPYTASQGAKNRLAEAMSWELTEKGIISIATNPGPVHSDRIYKTVYPKAAAEFLRIGGFQGLKSIEIEKVLSQLLRLLGQPETIISEGIREAANEISRSRDNTDLISTVEKMEEVISGLLTKVQEIAEKIQLNTAKMIVDGEFLTQDDVANMVMNLCDDDISRLINGRVVPNDRVFYPVKPLVGTSILGSNLLDPKIKDKVVVIAITSSSEKDLDRANKVAAALSSNNVKQVVILTKNPTDLTRFKGFH